MRECSPLTVPDLLRMRAEGRPIVALTAYDATFARLMELASVDLILVGDSLGMVIQGHATTLAVSLEDMIYHAVSVARGNQTALRVVDLPFMTCTSPDHALSSAARLIQEGGAHMVKLEGGSGRLAAVAALVKEGVPVCGHLGLLPQSILQVGVYGVQARRPDEAKRLIDEALRLQDAGLSLLVLECIPAELAQEITAQLSIPTLGIGAGRGCSGQVLVMQDLLGCSARCPTFGRDFLAGETSVLGAFKAYAAAVRDGSFPAEAESFR